MKVKITWEHGDADFETKSSFKMSKELLTEFLNFIYDMREWTPKHGKSQGHFQDGHYQKEDKHVDAINEKYDNKFEGYLEPDHRYSYPRAGIEEVWVKDVNKLKNIVWPKCINEVLINLPKIGDELNITTGSIGGASVFGKLENEILYNEFNDMGMGQIKGDGCDYRHYAPITVKVKDIKIDFGNRKEYKTEFTSFRYVVLCEYEDRVLTTTIDGYDKDFKMDEDFLYFH